MEIVRINCITSLPICRAYRRNRRARLPNYPRSNPFMEPHHYAYLE